MERLIDMFKRHENQVLRRANHTWSEIATFNGVAEKEGEGSPVSPSEVRQTLIPLMATTALRSH